MGEPHKLNARQYQDLIDDAERSGFAAGRLAAIEVLDGLVLTAPHPIGPQAGAGWEGCRIEALKRVRDLLAQPVPAAAPRFAPCPNCAVRHGQVVACKPVEPAVASEPRSEAVCRICGGGGWDFIAEGPCDHPKTADYFTKIATSEVERLQVIELSVKQLDAQLDARYAELKVLAAMLYEDRPHIVDRCFAAGRLAGIEEAKGWWYALTESEHYRYLARRMSADLIDTPEVDAASEPRSEAPLSREHEYCPKHRQFAPCTGCKPRSEAAECHSCTVAKRFSGVQAHCRVHGKPGAR
jgi:hypothetical protein